MSDNETLADIVAEIRTHIEAARDYPQDIDITTGDVEDWADRIEAVATTKQSSAVGNAAALREAMKRICAASILSKQANAPQWVFQRMADIFAMSTSALAAPPRNCDVGTAEEQEKRFDSFCCANYKPNNVDAECWGCPLMSHRNKCEFAWAQMPYEEGGAEC